MLITNKCVYPYNPEIEKYENLLVVDGIVSNLPGTCFVRLSRTYAYDSKRYQRETDAEVKIIDDLGNEMLLKDNSDGTYFPLDKDFAGIPCRKYKLMIKTLSGEMCESPFDELPEPVEIERVYYEYQSRGGFGSDGIQLFIDTYDPQNKSFYYIWEYNETWEYIVPFVSISPYLPEMQTCFKSLTRRSSISIQTTKNYVTDKVTQISVLLHYRSHKPSCRKILYLNKAICY